MSDKVQSFEDKFNVLINDCSKFLYMSRAREFQVNASEKIDALRKEAITLKDTCISAKEEDSANCLLGFEQAAEAFREELVMWVALKDDDPDEAWTHLVNAQMAAKDAIRAHQMFTSLNKYSKRLEILEKVLFPPQTFMSTGSTATSLECSICGQESGDCDHLPGKAYMGKFCSKIVHGISFTEISIVHNPGSKHHRVTAISEGEKMRNLMTWRIEAGEKPTHPA